MRGCFSIEWMAQSSQTSGSDQTQTLVPDPDSHLGPGPGPASCGTHSESLPGFYCRTKSESSLHPDPQHGLTGTRTQDLDLGLDLDPELDCFRLGNLQHQAPQVGSATEAETSGYESEGSRSLSPSTRPDSAPGSAPDSAPGSAPDSAPDSAPSSSTPPSPPSGRRPRTAFTSEQIGSLEAAFKTNAYLGTQDKTKLCRKLNLTDKQIRNWFQNRRMKLKRTLQDAATQADMAAHANMAAHTNMAAHANMASHFFHYPELQSYRPAPYARYQVGGQEAPPTVTSYLHPHGLKYGATLPSTLALDSYYPYGVVMPTYPPFY